MTLNPKGYRTQGNILRKLCSTKLSHATTVATCTCQNKLMFHSRIMRNSPCEEHRAECKMMHDCVTVSCHPIHMYMKYYYYVIIIILCIM